ncbi:hypothetical protein, partial [Shewanella algae]|uniref:hypothetical protein n=1 Tax=Shewanella algae TaxID=38313 RepID=UPI001AAD92DB
SVNLTNSWAAKSHGTNEDREYGCSSGLTKPDICVWLLCQKETSPVLASERCPYSYLGLVYDYGYTTNTQGERQNKRKRS